MSGCCGQGPVILSGATAPRVDVETVLLCDVLPDGTVAGVALVEPMYDTISGDRVGTRTVNPATGAPYTPTGTLQACQPDGCNATTTALVLCDTAGDGTVTSFVRSTTYDCEGALLGTLDRTLAGAAYAPTGTVGVCPVVSDCESPTTPTATIGLCLPDGTPIAVTVVRDCEGVVTSEGWINLRTGVFSAGAPPVGTVACGDSQSVQVSGTFCDVDTAGEVVGLVLIEYSYAADGAIDTVRLVDATTGATYVPTGTITTCPAGTGQPEQDLVQLCDVAGDGTSTPFIRDYRRDELGAVTGHTDYLLDGTAYVPTGTVGVCGAGCGDTEIAQLCDLTAAPAEPISVPADSFTLTGSVEVIGATLQFSRNNAAVTGVAQRAVTGLISGAASELQFDAGWGGGGSPAASNNAIYLAEVLDGTTVIATSTVNLSNGSGSAGAVVAQPPLAFVAPPSGTVTLRFTDLSTGGAVNRDLVIRPTTVETEGVSVASIPFLRVYTYDCTGLLLSATDTALDGFTPYTPVGDVAPCSGSGSGEECRNSSTVLVCDVPASSSTDIPTTIVDSNVAAVAQTQFQNHPGPYAPLWTGGTLVYPAGPGPAAQHLAVTGQITADVSECDGASGSLTISVRVRNNGPDTGQAWDGALRLFRGTTAIATHDALTWAPSGWQGTLTVSAPVTAADIAAGGIRVALILETYHLGAKSWTADQFDVTLELEGCEVTTATQFLRTLVTDCATGETITTVDTTVDGDPYTVTGEVGQCTPAESGSAADCRDCEQFVLCDVADSISTAFLRTVCRDCTGAVISTLDTDLDGSAPYAVAGTVGVCATPPAECEAAAVQAFRMCDLNPAAAPNDDGLVCATPFLRHFVYACDGTATFHDTEMDGVTAYTPTQVVECGENPPSLREQVWNTVSVVQDPVNPLVFTYTVANSEDPTQTGTVRMTASKAFGGGCGGTPTAPVWNAGVAFTFAPDATVLALADVLRVDAIDWDGWEDKVVSPAPNKVESDLGHSLNPGNRWHSAASNNTGHFYFNGPPTSVTMSNRNDGGGLACVAPAFGFITLVPGPPCGVLPEVDHIVQPLCDVAAAGTTTSFLRHWAVNNSSGLLTALGDTTLNGTTAYAPTGNVTVCGQQPDMPVLTGVRRLTGSTVLQNLKTEFPGLQSISLSVVAGVVNVAMSSGGGQPIPAGASVTWSASDTDDSSLAAASFAGATAAADYFLVWTYKAGAAG
ncbi:hypothetical protein [Streptomyces sp. NPDC005148]